MKTTMNIEMEQANLDNIVVTPAKQNIGDLERSISSLRVEKGVAITKVANPNQDEKKEGNGLILYDTDHQESKRNLIQMNNPEQQNIESESLKLNDYDKTQIQPDMEIVWDKIKIVAKHPNQGFCKKKGNEMKEKIILNELSGNVKSGECLAILGSTGAGKTTLLNYLSRKIESKSLSIKGSVTLNGNQIDSDRFALIASYVMQDDILEATMTPLEILIFTAKLKYSLPIEEIEIKVQKMIQDLHLTRCQNTRVGSVTVRGISGGERKRTSIGVELISDPKIIFLDEPTTGLDSYNAYEVIQLLRNLSAMGKIVIFTIHQPSSEIFQLLDKVCILALGKTVYFGPKEKCLSCFEFHKIPIPPNYNPFEHFMETTNVSSVENPKILSSYPMLQSITNLQERYEAYVTTLNTNFEENKTQYIDNYAHISGFTEDNLKLFADKKVNKNFQYEFGMIFGRNMIITMRNPKMLFIKIMQHLLNSVLVAALYVRLSKDFSGIQDRLGLILLCLVMTILGATTQTILTFSDERKVFTRERSNNLYSVLAYFLAKTLSEIPVFFVSGNLFAVIAYMSAELNDLYSYKYYIFIGIIQICSIAGASYAYFIGTLATHQETLVNINSALTIPLMLLSGFFANADSFAPYLIPLKYISVFKYGFQVFIHNEFSDNNFNCFATSPDLCSPMANRFTFLEPYYISYIAIASLIILFKCLAFILLYLLAKIKV